MNRLYKWFQFGRKISAGRYSALDGYRGIFVVLVMLYHFGFTGLAGGWVAINHFFMFSGYLISSILIKEKTLTGTIRPSRFYLRRARRIVPAMLLVVTAVVVHTALFAPAQVKSRIGGDALATLGFFLNWRLIQRNDDYFDHFHEPSPLRHLWTLGIEEQFYLFIPFLILLLATLFHRRTTRALIAFSLALGSAWWTAHLGYHSVADQARLYYGTDTRMQALLVGVTMGFILSIGADKTLPAKLPRSLTHALGISGFIISLSAIFILTPTTAWVYNNGGMLAFSIFASLFIFAAVSEPSLMLNRVIGWKPLAFLGQISYGLYLFHWPLHLWMPLENWPLALAAFVKLVLTFFLALISFRYLEFPIMEQGLAGIWPKTIPRRRIVFATTTVILIAAGAAYLAQKPAPFSHTAANVDYHNIPALIPGQTDYTPPQQPRTIAVSGDSVAYLLAENYPQQSLPGIKIENLAEPGCDFLDHPHLWLSGEYKGPDEKCRRNKANFTKNLKEMHPDAVLLLLSNLSIFPHKIPAEPAAEPQSVWAASSDPQKREIFRLALEKKLTETKTKITSAGVPQMFVATIACRGEEQLKFPGDFAKSVHQSQEIRAEFLNPVHVNRILTDWAHKNNVPVIDLAGALCRQPFPQELHGQKIYADSIHFSPNFSPILWKWIAPQITAVTQ